MNAKQARRKFQTLYKHLIVAHAYSTTTPKHGDNPWTTLKDIERLLRHKKKALQELRAFFMQSSMGSKVRLSKRK